MNRRDLLVHGLALTPMTAALLAACGDEPSWPEGMSPIKWDRDTCARCSMAISDRRFAAQLRGGPNQTTFKFDDIGCAVTWCSEKIKQHPWMSDADTRFWVADAGGKGEKWLDAKRAHFVNGPRSPMGYDFAAHAEPQAGSVDFQAMSRTVLEAWPAHCEPPRPQPASSAP